MVWFKYRLWWSIFFLKMTIVEKIQYSEDKTVFTLFKEGLFYKRYVLLPVAGNRNNSNGSLNNVGSNGNYWSSTVDGTNSRNLYFNSSNANMNNNNRANGNSVRCLRIVILCMVQPLPLFLLITIINN
jgi:hypothetical protein